jgi:hypothetical protein
LVKNEWQDDCLLNAQRTVSELLTVSELRDQACAHAGTSEALHCHNKQDEGDAYDYDARPQLHSV